MSLRFYLGNYPSEFTRKDIEYVFRNFEGVLLEKMCKKDKKCFSFLHCRDIDQLVSIIQSLNNTKVSGRKLKVRACDSGLQDYVNLLIEDAKSDVVSDAVSTPFIETNDHTNYEIQSTPYATSKSDTDYDAESVPSVPLQVMKNESSSNVEHSFNQKYEHEYSTKEKYEKDIDENFFSSPARSLCSNGDGSDSYATGYNSQSNIESPQINYANKSFLQYRESNTNYDAESVPYVPLQVMKNECSSNVEHSFKQQYEHEYSTKEKYEKDIDEKFFSSPARSLCSNGDGSDSYATGYSSQSNIESPQINYAKKSFLQYQESSTNYDAESVPFTPLQVLKNECSSNMERSFKQQYEHEYSTKEKYEKDIDENLFSSPAQVSYSNDDGSDSYSTACSSQSNIEPPEIDYAKKSFLQYRESNELTWLSFTNFPLGTSIKSVYELFSDYNPIKVKMICNEPRRDRTLTEAHICFPNRDIADDVILTFDNTFFNGRLILVTDIEDLTIMNELLDVFSS